MMIRTKLLILISLLIVLVSCNNTSSKKKNLDLINSDPPIDISDLDAKFYKNINYGKNKNDSFDLFLPKTKNKSPLVIFIHGGGFVGGNKEKAYKGEYPEQI
ncbi:hypothetical protein MNBD_IGNAVI01-1235 [hydrothermal vent metagenome]|uniref:Uncharacterized protein n=1 Tax=hydrothermal vent metagenome TaxID=652676 RepID=A0A3B1BMS0_9ZZZZ